MKKKYDHSRTCVVDQARLELLQFLLDLEHKHGLTFGELLAMLGEKVADLASYQIRAERRQGKVCDEP